MSTFRHGLTAVQVKGVLHAFGHAVNHEFPEPLRSLVLDQMTPVLIETLVMPGAQGEATDELREARLTTPDEPCILHGDIHGDATAPVRMYDTV